MIPYSIIIPARDEEAVIGDTLRFLLGGVAAGEPTPPIVVVCNGCRDRTADRARDASDRVAVVELERSGKCAAINAGLELAPPGAVFVMDADIRLRLAGFERMAAAFDGGQVDAVSPTPHFVSDHSSRAVQRFYRVFARHPYLARAVGGAGVWGVSADARERLGLLPEIIADDGYVRAHFPAGRQRRITLDRTTGPLVAAPRTDDDLLRSELRWRRGDAQLAALPAAAMVNASDAIFHRGDLIRLVGRSLGDPIGLLTYVAFKLRGRTLSRAGRPAEHPAGWSSVPRTTFAEEHRS